MGLGVSLVLQALFIRRGTKWRGTRLKKKKIHKKNTSACLNVQRCEYFIAQKKLSFFFSKTSYISLRDVQPAEEAGGGFILL